MGWIELYLASVDVTFPVGSNCHVLLYMLRTSGIELGALGSRNHSSEID